MAIQTALAAMRAAPRGWPAPKSKKLIGPNTTANYGRLFIALKPKKERDSLNSIIGRLRAKARQIPGMQAFFQPIQNLNIGGRISKSQYQYVMQSGDTESLYRAAPDMRDKIEKIPGLLDVTTDLYIKF